MRMCCISFAEAAFLLFFYLHFKKTNGTTCGEGDV
jgi:hypothetical protein